MRSGEHALWDAYVSTAPVRAELAAHREAMRRLARALRPCMRAFEAAALESAKALRNIAAAVERGRLSGTVAHRSQSEGGA